METIAQEAKRKAFSTRHALTKGIIEVEGQYDQINEYLQFGRKYYQYLKKGEFFFTIEEAIANAEQRRVKKLQSIEKQVKRITAIKFR